MRWQQIGLWIAGGQLERARGALLVALQGSGGNLAEAARNLGCSLRQIHRWVDRLELRVELGEIRGGH